MLKQIISAIKISALALILSFGLSYVYAWTTPSANPPSGNVDAPINVSGTAQVKTGALTVGGLTTGTLNVTAGAGAAKVLTSDANGNATWQVAAGGSDNLGNHTATQALNMGTNNINASGADTTFGALTIQGEKNNYSGIQFKNAAGSSVGTLMMHPTASGFYNAADNNWRMYVTDGGAGSMGNVYANDYYSYAAGKWMSQGLRQNSCSWIVVQPNGHSGGNGTLYSQTCPLGSYVAGFSLRTWGQYATYDHQILCCPA